MEAAKRFLRTVKYSTKLAKEIALKHLEEGRTIEDLAREYNSNVGSIELTIHEYRCREGILTEKEKKEVHDFKPERGEKWN